MRIFVRAACIQMELYFNGLKGFELMDLRFDDLHQHDLIYDNTCVGGHQNLIVKNSYIWLMSISHNTMKSQCKMHIKQFNSTDIYAMLQELKISRQSYLQQDSIQTISLNVDDSLDEYQIAQSMDNHETYTKQQEQSLIYDDLQSSKCFMDDHLFRQDAGKRILTEPNVITESLEQFSFRDDSQSFQKTKIMPQLKPIQSIKRKVYRQKEMTSKKVNVHNDKENHENHNRLIPAQIKQKDKQQGKTQRIGIGIGIFKKCNITPHKFSNYKYTQSYLKLKPQTELKRKFI